MSGSGLNAPSEAPEFIVAQYEQLHEMRREYNRFIFQAPTIVVAVVGATLAVLSQISPGSSLPLNLDRYAYLLLVVGGFTLVLGYWALRSQVLLRASEHSLKQMEEIYGNPLFAMYPYEVSHKLRHWERWPSTRYIVMYLLLVGGLLVVLGVTGLCLQFVTIINLP